MGEYLAIDDNDYASLQLLLDVADDAAGSDEQDEEIEALNAALNHACKMLGIPRG
jgi:hypothetical protein